MDIEQQNEYVMRRIKNMTDEEKEYIRIMINNGDHRAYQGFKTIDEFKEYKKNGGTENFGHWYHRRL